MAATPGDLDREAVGSGHHGPGVDADGAGLHRGPVVHGKDGLHRKAVKQPVFHHHAGTGKTFFARLEHQHGGAVEVARFREVARGANQHGGVAVVAATVHEALFARLPGEVVVLGQRQGIHVGAQAHHAAAGRAAPPNDAHHARAPDAVVDLIHTAELQRFLDAFAGVNLFKTQLGMGVQVTPQCRQLGVVLRDVREGAATGFQTRALHQWPPALPTRRRGSTAKYSRSTTRLIITKINAIRHR